MANCENHPDREAKRYTGWNAYLIYLCDECTPPWFKDLDEDDPEQNFDGGSFRAYADSSSVDADGGEL